METNADVRAVDSCETKLWNGGGRERERENSDTIVEIMPT